MKPANEAVVIDKRIAKLSNYPLPARLSRLRGYVLMQDLTTFFFDPVFLTPFLSMLTL
jgi:hypothetical protein